MEQCCHSLSSQTNVYADVNVMRIAEVAEEAGGDHHRRATSEVVLSFRPAISHGLEDIVSRSNLTLPSWCGTMHGSDNERSCRNAIQRKVSPIRCSAHLFLRQLHWFDSDAILHQLMFAPVVHTQHRDDIACEDAYTAQCRKRDASLLLRNAVRIDFERKGTSLGRNIN